MAEPNDYDEKYLHWDIEDLPIIPEEWMYKISSKKRLKKQFSVLKQLMNRDDVIDILCATDAGREGELIFRLVYQQAECKKPFRRIWLSSLEESAIREAFASPKSASDYDTLFEAARIRSFADWIVGYNATRYFSCLYSKPGKPLNVGRVKSPTLAMIVDREKEIESFIPEPFYTVNLNIGGIVFESRRFDNKDEAIKVEQKCKETTSEGSVAKAEHHNNNFNLDNTKKENEYMKKTVGYALAPKQLVDNKLKVRFMYREEPDDATDSGWRFFSGDESDEYVKNPENIGLYDIETISQIDPDIIPLLSNDVGTAFERESGEEPFRVSL